MSAVRVAMCAVRVTVLALVETFAWLLPIKRLLAKFRTGILNHSLRVLAAAIRAVVVVRCRGASVQIRRNSKPILETVGRVVAIIGSAASRSAGVLGGHVTGGQQQTTGHHESKAHFQFSIGGSRGFVMRQPLPKLAMITKVGSWAPETNCDEDDAGEKSEKSEKSESVERRVVLSNTGGARKTDSIHASELFAGERCKSTTRHAKLQTLFCAAVCN